MSSGPNQMIEIPEDIKTREGMQLFLLLNDVRNLIHNLNAEVKGIKQTSIEEAEFLALKQEVSRLSAIVDTVGNTGKTILIKLFEKGLYALFIAALGSDVIYRILHHG